MLRDNVKNRGADNLAWMIKAHAMQNARATIVPGGIEAIMPERGHDLDLILRHGAEGIVRMIGAARRLLGIAVPAQIGRHHRKLFGKPRREFVPG